MKKVHFASVPVCILLLSTSAVHAGDSSTDTAPDKDKAVTLAPAPTTSPWETNVRVWPWLPEFVGNIGLLGQTTPINLDEGRVLQALRAAAFGEVDVRYKRFSFELEGFYAKIGLGVTPGQPLIEHINVSIDVVNVDWSFAYRPLEGRFGYLDLVGGARYLRIDLGLDLRPGPEGETLLKRRSLSGTEDTIDPYFGARGRINFSRRYYAAFRGDYASFGMGSRVDWQVYCDLGVQFSQHWTAEVGYRYIRVDYTHDDFRFNMHVDGPQLRIGYTF